MSVANWTPPEPLGSRPDAVFSRPTGPTAGPLPVLYLLHGQFDWETDWWAPEKGRLGDVLRAERPAPMLLVAPLCVRRTRSRTAAPGMYP